MGRGANSLKFNTCGIKYTKEKIKSSSFFVLSYIMLIQPFVYNHIMPSSFTFISDPFQFIKLLLAR